MVLVETNFEASKTLYLKALQSLKNSLDQSTITKARFALSQFYMCNGGVGHHLAKSRGEFVWVSVGPPRVLVQKPPAGLGNIIGAWLALTLRILWLPQPCMNQGGWSPPGAGVG